MIDDKKHLNANIENMKKRLADFEHKRGELEYDLMLNRKSRKKLEDVRTLASFLVGRDSLKVFFFQSMAQTIGNSEQREIWSLLFRLHEVEVDSKLQQ